MTDRVWTRDLVTAIIALWITAGEFLDGWAHVHGFTDKTFFTPWHGILYAGLIAFGLWIAVIVLSTARRLGPSRRSWREVIRELPRGYRGGFIGLAIFVFGAPSDLYWHEVFGFEGSIEALLSPPHILLLCGWLLMVSTAWRSQRAVSAHATVPEIISLASVVSLVGFFVAYKSPFRRAAPLMSYDTNGDDLASEWVAALLVTTALLVVPLLWQIRDGRHRVGTLTALVAAVGLGGALGVSKGWGIATLLAGVIGATIGALVAELLLAKLRPLWTSWTYGLPIVMAETAVLIWGGLYIGYAIAGPFLWPPAVWAGSILLAASMAASLGAIAWRPAAGGRPSLGAAAESDLAAAALRSRR